MVGTVFHADPVVGEITCLCGTVAGEQISE
jgi:hypothetical protein